MTTTVATTQMTEQEARDCVRQINEKLGSLRALLLDLYQRKGWQALGYGSWRDCAVNEFSYDTSYVYRLLAAAQVEQNLNSPMGEIPERQLRELAHLEPEQQRTVWKVMDLAAKELGVPHSTTLAKSVVTMITTGIVTGTLDGETTLTEAAKNTVVAEFSELRARQKAHINADKPKPLVFEATLDSNGVLEFFTDTNTSALKAGVRYRFVVYEVVDE